LNDTEFAGFATGPAWQMVAIPDGMDDLCMTAGVRKLVIL